MKNKIKALTPSTVSPFSTGGGGTRFEWLVAISYLVALLRGEAARGLSNSDDVIEVRFQQKPLGYEVDDIVILAGRGTREAKLALQVKRSIRFSANALFCEVMAACWKQSTIPGFDKVHDYVGIAIGEGCNTTRIRTHVQEMLEWARTSSSFQTFYGSIKNYKEKQECLRIITDSLTMGLGRRVSTRQLWLFLRRFVVIAFDFDYPGARDAIDCWNSLKSIFPKRNVDGPKALFAAMYELVSRYSQSAGALDFDALLDELRGFIPITCTPDTRTIRAALVKQVCEQLEREKKSRKYIPDVFTEIHTVKDSARLFSHPTLFVEKTIEHAGTIDTTFLNYILSKIHLSPFTIALPKGLKHPQNISDIPSLCSELKSHFGRILGKIDDDYHPEKWKLLKKGMSKDAEHTFKKVKFLLSSPGYRVRRSLQSACEDLDKAKSSILLITSRAGQGKTNFVCDFAENFLIRRGVPCALITGREFRNMPVGHLDAHIVNIIMGANFAGSLEDLLGLVGKYCAEINKPFTLIFDGINEHSRITDFAGELERLIERLLEFAFVRIILTCRSEYFEARFSNLRNASFSDQVFQISEIQRSMSGRHRQEMLHSYFVFFKIRPGHMSGNAVRTLRDDPLLLRFFCEAYGDPQAATPTRLPSMPDIYRDTVFRLYLNKKLDEISEREKSELSVPVQAHRLYKELLKHFVEIMIADRKFSDIPVSSLDTKYHSIMADLIAEDMLIRKDIIQGKSVLDPDTEIVNFTFDEFRDFLIADHLLYKVFEKEAKEEFTSLLLELTEKTSAVAEGLSKYLFYAAKRSGNHELVSILEGMPWYEEIFLPCIFSVEDKYVTDDDVAKIRKTFRQNSTTARHIVIELMMRWDTDGSNKLTINLLFDILETLSDAEYNILFRPVFEATGSRYPLNEQPLYKINELTSDVEDLAKRVIGRWERKCDKLLELLLHLLPIRGDNYGHPASDLFLRFGKEHPERAFAMLEKHADTRVSMVRASLWGLIAEIANCGAKVPATLVKKANNLVQTKGSQPSVELVEVLRFLEACTCEKTDIKSSARMPSG